VDSKYLGNPISLVRLIVGIILHDLTVGSAVGGTASPVGSKVGGIGVKTCVGNGVVVGLSVGDSYTAIII
jgi:hypothetical protein